MLLYPKYKRVLLHAPRTGGNYIYSLVNNNPEYVVLKGIAQHATIDQVKEMFPDWSTYVILRKPHDIFYSYFYFCKNIIYNKHGRYPEKLVEFARFCNPDAGVNRFTENLIERNIVCKFGGFLETYTEQSTHIMSWCSTKIQQQLRDHFDIDYKYDIDKSSMVCNDGIGYTYLPYYDKNEYFKKLISKFCYKDFDNYNEFYGKSWD